MTRRSRLLVLSGLILALAAGAYAVVANLDLTRFGLGDPIPRTENDIAAVAAQVMITDFAMDQSLICCTWALSPPSSTQSWPEA